MSAYRRHFAETKYISFLIKDDELSKNAMKLEKMLKVISKKKN